MTLPDLKSTAQLDTAPWSKGVDTILKDLRSVQDLSKKVGTLKITVDMSAARDAQRVTAGVRAAVDNMVPSDMQRRIDGMFGSINTNAARSASVFEEQGSRVALLRARINELSNAVRLTRAEFQSGLGEASPQEIAELSARMGTLRTQLDAVGQEAKETFGEWSNEALKASMATRTAVQTVEAANGRISRLGLASQVKLGASAALAEFGPMAGGAANGLIQLARSSEQARLSSGFFEKQIQKQNIQVSQARQEVDMLAGAFNVMPNVVENTFKVLLRNGYTLQQASETMKLYAASALAANQDVGGAYNALADDVQRGTTIMSNSYGITANQATAWNQYAQSIGTTTDKLTAAQKAEGFLVQLRRESTQELEDADTILKGYAGSYGQMNLELQRSGQELGQNIMPLLTNGTRALVGLLDFFNQLPAPVRNSVTALGLAAVAVGVLAIPVGGLASAYTALTTAKAANVAVTTVETAATTRLNVVTTIKNVLLMDTAKAYAIANTWAMRHNGSMAASVAVNNSVSASLVTLKGTIAGVAGAISIYTVAATAALALGLYWADSVKKTTGIYEQMDAANQASFERTMARVQELRRSGTELGRAQARYLLLNQQLQDAQQGELKGVNWLTGERIYGPPDEVRIKKLQADLATTRQNITLLYTEAQRRGQLNLKLTEDQTKAVKELNKVLEGRQFDLKLTGLTDMQRDLAKIGQDFDKLRQDFKKPFVVNGKLMDSAQTPALRDGLNRLDAQRRAEEQNVRKQYADQAVKAAQDSARAVQKAEIEAMQEGRAKKAAERKLEIEELQRANKEEADQYKDFPEQYKQIVADGQREVAALKRKHRQEDIATAEDHARRIKEAEARAAQSVLDTMQDGYAKQELARRLALDQLKSDIAERVKALEGDPAAQAKVKSEGQKEITNQIKADNLARLKEVQDAQAAIRDAEQAGADARVAALADGFAKEEAARALALVKLKESYRRRIEAEKGRPDVQKALMGERDDAVASLETQNAQARTAAIKAGNDAVYEAQKAARTAEMALIKDDLAKKQAAQNEELTDLQRNIQKKLDGFRGTEEQRKKILEEGQRQYRALVKKYAQDDEQDAKERAQRIADAWADVQSKQFAAQQASRARQLAQFEADAARRQLALKETPVAQAQAALDDIPKRFALQREAAQKQFSWEETQAALVRDKALRAENLTAEGKKIIWAEYNAALKKLGEDRVADETKSLADKVAAAHAAQEAMRLARIAEANKPVQQSENRQQELQWARDLSVSDAEILRINQEISAERAKQIQALQGQLDGVNGVKLTVEERRQVEGQIKQLQHDQAVAVRDQRDAQRALLQATLDRQQAEADFSEKWARSDADLLTARLATLGVYQRRLAQLDTQIAGEGREVERNALLQQRLGLLTQIGEKQAQIDAMPGEAEQRRVQALQAQRGYLLTLAGLSDNQVAQAQERVRIAREEVLLAAQAVQSAKTQAEQEAARTELVQKNTGLVSAELELTRARNQQQNQALDLLEARARAELQLRDLADDAVATAQLDLDVTRQKLALIGQQLAAGGLTGTDQLALQRQQVELTGQQASQERALTQAQRDRATLLEELARSTRDLNTELEGSARRATPLQAAFRGIAEARTTLVRAERAYNEAVTSGKPERIKSATEALTGAIRGQRDAVAGLAEEYRRLLASQDGVRESSDKLKKVIYGDDPKTNPGTFDGSKELSRLRAIQARRDAAQQELITALKEGDPQKIADATNKLAEQQKRTNDQRKLLIDKGYGGAINQSAGDRLTRQLSDQVDALGIAFDKEAPEIDRRAAIAEQEAASVMSFGEYVGRFESSVEALTGKEVMKPPKDDPMLQKLKSDPNVRTRPMTQQEYDKFAAVFKDYGVDLMKDVAQGVKQGVQVVRQSLDDISYIYQGQRFRSLAERDAWIRSQEARPTTAPAPSYSYVLNVGGISITAPSDKAADIRRTVNEALDDRIADARRTKSWGGNKCP